VTPRETEKATNWATNQKKPKSKIYQRDRRKRFCREKGNAEGWKMSFAIIGISLTVLLGQRGGYRNLRTIK